jgi:hypothetical protein
VREPAHLPLFARFESEFKERAEGILALNSIVYPEYECDFVTRWIRRRDNDIDNNKDIDKNKDTDNNTDIDNDKDIDNNNDIDKNMVVIRASGTHIREHTVLRSSSHT